MVTDNYIFYRDILAIGIGWIVFGLVMIGAGISDLIEARKAARMEAVNA